MEDSIIVQPQIDESKNFFGGIYHPWRRFFARFLDLSIAGLICFYFVVLIIEWMIPSTSQIFSKFSENQIKIGLIFFVVWIPFEATLLSKFGTTPGKRLFGIILIMRNGEKLSFIQALQRSFFVALSGQAFGIPIIMLITQFFAYKRLTKTGSTLWDDRIGSVVTHSEWTLTRTVICTICVIVVLFSLSVLNAS